MVRPNSTIEGVQQVPTPPAGFIEKDVEIIKLQQGSVDTHIVNGLASINFEFITTTPLNQSGTAKEVDKDELNNTVHSVAEDIVRCMDWVYWMTARYRYGLLYQYDDVVEMVPKVSVPEKYDILSSLHLEEQFGRLKTGKANPAILNAVEIELANKAFNNDPEVSELVQLVLSLDPLANISEEDKMVRLSNKGITQAVYVVSSNIQEFVQRAIAEKPGFAEMELTQQKEIIMGYAQEQIEKQDAELKVEMPPEIDPVTGLPIEEPILV
jgi:hypothetical protein